MADEEFPFQMFEREEGYGFLVPSSDEAAPDYKVFCIDAAETFYWTCSCKSFWFRDKVCKHIELVRRNVDLKSSYAP